MAARADVLLVSLGSTAGLRASDAAFAGALRRAGAHVEVVAAARRRQVRTLALTDLAWAHAARVAAEAGIARWQPRAVVYSTMGAALLWPRPGAIRYDAPAAANRPGHHGLWQRPVERRRLREAPLLVPVAEGPSRRRRRRTRRRSSCRSPSRRRPTRARPATSRRSPTRPIRGRRAWTASSPRGRRRGATARSSSSRAPTRASTPWACAWPGGSSRRRTGRCCAARASS